MTVIGYIIVYSLAILAIHTGVVLAFNYPDAWGWWKPTIAALSAWCIFTGIALAWSFL